MKLRQGAERFNRRSRKLREEENGVFDFRNAEDYEFSDTKSNIFFGRKGNAFTEMRRDKEMSIQLDTHVKTKTVTGTVKEKTEKILREIKAERQRLSCL